MLSTEQNDLITRIGPATPAGELIRRYWQPAALVDELNSNRPIKTLRLLGEDLVLFRDERGPVCLYGAGRAAGISALRLLRRARHPHVCLQGNDRLQLAAVARSRYRPGAYLVPAPVLSG